MEGADAVGSDARWKEIGMALTFRRNKVEEAEPPGQPGGWYADPYGTAARRWYDPEDGWSDRVEGAGQPPDKTGLTRMDESAVTAAHATRPVDENGKLVPLARPVDPKYMADARPVR
jgi:hypothetical protein